MPTKHCLNKILTQSVLFIASLISLTSNGLAKQPITIEKNILTSTNFTINTAQKVLVLYDQQTNRLGGWDHTQHFADEFIGLKLAAESYEVMSPQNTSENYSTTLVKKLGDWQHQHGNGIIADISAEKLQFSQLAGITLLIKINSSRSFIPDAKQIARAYGDKLSATQLAALDDSNVYLSLALFGATSEPDKTTFNADYVIKIDGASELDRWLSIYLPLKLLSPYLEQNYQQQMINQAQANKQILAGLRIMAETASTKVVRNLLLDEFSAATPKLFKEIGLELHYLALVYADD